MYADMYFIFHVTSQDHLVEMLYIYIWMRACHYFEKFGDHRYSDSLEEKCFIKNANLINFYTTEKLSWWINTRQKKSHNLKNRHFEMKFLEIKKYIFPLMTTFYNFTLKIEKSWTKMVIKSILETGNANDVIVYVWFIYFQIKNIKSM